MQTILLTKVEMRGMVQGEEKEKANQRRDTAGEVCRSLFRPQSDGSDACDAALRLRTLLCKHMQLAQFTPTTDCDLVSSAAVAASLDQPSHRRQ